MLERERERERGIDQDQRGFLGGPLGFLRVLFCLGLWVFGVRDYYGWVFVDEDEEEGP